MGQVLEERRCLAHIERGEGRIWLKAAVEASGATGIKALTLQPG